MIAYLKSAARLHSRRVARTDVDSSHASGTVEGAGRFLPFVAAGTLVVSFGVAIFARFFRAPRIDQTTDQQTDESDPYLAGMVMVALRAEERRDAERFRAEMAEFGIGFPLHHVERF